LHDLALTHCALNDQLTGKKPEALHVSCGVLKHRQVPVVVHHPIGFAMHRNVLIDLFQASWEYRQLRLRHALSFSDRPLSPQLTGSSHFLDPAKNTAEIRRSESSLV